ncbi:MULTISPECIES: phosphate/phosphite/phosphonate ABC transporter substrate-binding protein [Sporomusa]|uniref:substrate-binding domain-containing protein n=1 Tax=Sporomusa TaxID=2375 RepID=UPI00166A4C13|nr:MULTISPECIES: phosphate/phosphite/phosphonate ABC transporter substrate-binding protein [Sporomusa]HML35647.1 phosphate/phosphite/phosphonate ABC transporter substrate-binding protein [Sporomusa sphaeroides]
MQKWITGLILIMVTAFFVGCSSQPAQTVRLQHLDEAIPAKGNTNGALPLRVAVSSILSPRETLMVYQPLLSYLEKKLAMPVVLLQRRTYKEVNELIEHDSADIAFVCSGGYVAGHQSFGLELLAVPIVNGQHTYRSYIIVNAKLEAHSISALKGRSFAFTDPMSFSGRIAPVYMLHSQNIDTAHFFGRTFYTYSHDNAIQAVKDGIADAAAVDSLVFDQALQSDPELTKRVKIIDQSLMVGSPPVVVNRALDRSRKENLRSLLLVMQFDPDGKKALSALHYERFAVPDEKDYEALNNIWMIVREKL